MFTRRFHLESVTKMGRQLARPWGDWPAPPEDRNWLDRHARRALAPASRFALGGFGTAACP